MSKAIGVSGRTRNLGEMLDAMHRRSVLTGAMKGNGLNLSAIELAAIMAIAFVLGLWLWL